MKDQGDKKLDNVVRFPLEAVSRLGFKRAPERNGPSDPMESEGQLTLFGGDAPTPALAEVVAFPQHLSLFEEAVVLDERGDGRAVEAYIKAIEGEDCVADAWCNLGVVRSNEDDLDAAFDCFAQSLANDPHHAASHYNIGNLYFEIGDLRVARTHYELAASLAPEFPNVFFNLGLVAALTEDYQAANEALLHYKLVAGDGDVAVADELLGYIQTAINLS